MSSDDWECPCAVCTSQDSDDEGNAVRKRKRGSRFGILRCARCEAVLEVWVSVLVPVAGQFRPPFPLCRRCYAVYLAVPSPAAADAFVLQAVSAMRARSQG